MTPIIKITDGITRHPDWRMAEPVNMEILPGEQVAICGDNASGKSRLVEILTGHYPLLRNEVFYNFDNSGTEAGTPTHKRLISEQLRFISFRDSYGEQDGTYYYQQRWNQHDIDENTPTVGSLLDKIPEYQPGLRQRLYKMFALEPVLDKYIISLSSGELRKFQLIRTLLHSPRVLIMDNPFIGLDASTRDLLQRLLETLTKDTDLTVILVLSKYDDIPTFVTHVIPVKEMKVMPKQTRLQFLQNAAYDALYTLPQDQVAAIRNLPHKDITSIPFYPQNGGEILRLCNVSVRYGNRTILNDVNWIIHEGEKWALQGQNGSGKSTLLSLVCADNPQSYACDINIFGHRRGSGESIWQIKQHIGYVSPEMHRAYMRDLPAIDIVASGLSDSVGLYFHPRPEQLDTCQSWMGIFGISHIQDKTFLKLSSGEQRLCLLARAFVKDPELLILDEPLHGLDINNRQRVRDIIQLFCQRPHKTLIMVTHYTDELPDCITHNLILKRNL
ncbi:MAG: ATP-binding cassette domain-containing protein [Bacteroides sp.]|nr:ATP-binding cassette domain-containing protein [Bacteroides sp.]MCM1447013.1 ATP-binding cassette domain-containing protein [Bacteroides sp.]MCM1515023.1 ATP-binding cassette domain-containing protein [Paraprevotella sp.]